VSRIKAIEICRNLNHTIENYVPSLELKLSEQFTTKKVKLSFLKDRYKQLMDKYKIKIKEVII
jgi:hypothetical protein